MHFKEALRWMSGRGSASRRRFRLCLPRGSETFAPMFIARLIPWWLFASLAVLFGALTIQSARTGSETNAQIEAALSAPAPAVVALAQLGETSFTPPLNEFAVTGFDFAYVGPLNNDQAVLFVHASEAPGVYVAFTEYNPMGITLEGAFEEINSGDNAGILRGVLREARRSDRTFAALFEAESLPPAQVIYLADILRGERETALQGYRQRNGLLTWIPAVFALACALAAFTKFRAWRRKRQAV